MTIEEIEKLCRELVDKYPPPKDTVYITDASAPLILKLLDVAKAAKDTWSVYQKFCEIYDPEEKKPINWHKIWALMQEHANTYGALQIRLQALESSPKVKEKSQPFDCEEIEKAFNALNEHTSKVSE
jgi:hypothetical protein